MRCKATFEVEVLTGNSLQMIDIKQVVTFLPTFGESSKCQKQNFLYITGAGVVYETSFFYGKRDQRDLY